MTSGKIADRFFWGANQDELLCENDNFVLCDHLGTVRKIVGANAKAVSTLDYDAFGKLISCEGDLPRFRYTGKLFDDETGLQWNINRWYDATVGRWISEDPIGFGGGDTSLYRYVKNNSISFSDILGLWKIDRKKTANKLTITSEKGDTIQSLANEIGLGVAEYLNWTTVGTGSTFAIQGKSGRHSLAHIGISDIWCPGQEIMIPNTIISILYDDPRPRSQRLDWVRDKEELKKLGFLVVGYDSATYPVLSDTNTDFLGAIQQYSDSKMLHGLVIYGHGDPTMVGISRDVGLQFTDISTVLHYRLAAAIIYACEAASAVAASLVSASPSKIYWASPNKHIQAPWNETATTNDLGFPHATTLWGRSHEATGEYDGFPTNFQWFRGGNQRTHKFLE